MLCAAHHEDAGRDQNQFHCHVVAQIKREVMVVGVANIIEIWSKDKWLEFYANSKQSYEQIAEKIIDIQ